MKAVVLCCLVFAGGGLGALARHGVNEAARYLAHTDFPIATVFVNGVGSLLMGLAAAYWQRMDAGDPARVFVMTGLLGGFTTFSAFSHETMTLLMRGALGQAALYFVASIGLPLGGVFAGFALARVSGAAS